MLPIEAEHALDRVLNGNVRRKANRTGSLRIRANRIARGSPEVLVKITGFGKGASHIYAHLSYITRNAKLALETDRGDILRDSEAVKDLFRQWTDEIGHSPQRKNQRDTMHLVVSMPEGTPETAVLDAARAYAKKTFSANHEYVFALHTDEPHPHVHLTVKMVGFDGKKLNPRKADLQAWREAFAREMRDQGIDAEATPRAARGVVRKAENSVVRHIERGDERRPPRVPRVKAARSKAVVEELIAEADGRATPEKPWEPRIKERRQLVRNAWLTAATALEQRTAPYKEHYNAPPEYDKLDPARVQAAQRAAAVCQSDLERLALGIPAVALARMRDVSRLDVVQHQRPAQVFLHTHAPHGMGRDGTADHDLRRARTRALTITAGTGNGSREGERLSGGASVQRTLAAAIHGFVGGMPPVDTERDELRRRLISQFSREQERDRLRGVQSEISMPDRSNLKTHDR
jgi:type IV secretory pathway VirD2 relaxase